MTPRSHLDTLARQGVRFERAYVAQPGCSPSRASLLTGLYPHQHDQIALAAHRFEMFSAEARNLPRLLRERGYRTGCLGKIHVNPESAFVFQHHRGGSAGFSLRDMRAVAREAGDFVAQDTAL